jgi:predicted secreted hydrolase
MSERSKLRARLFGVLALVALPVVALPLVALPLVVARGIAQDQEDDGWRRITAPLELSWPRDHGAHPDTRTEWWYATGELEDGDGARFGYQLTIFREGIDPRPPKDGESRLRAREVIAGHFALVELADGRFVDAERLRRAGLGLAGASRDDLYAFVEDWSIERRADDTLRLRARDRAGGGIALDLELRPQKPLVLHGEGGVSRKGSRPGDASAYASWTRLASAGTITFSGREHAVRGESWFDHEWGSSELGKEISGWDWYGLRLADGRELMLYRLRGSGGAAAASASATLVERDGTTRTLAASEFELLPISSWKSPRSGAEYPLHARIRVPSAGLDLEVDARVEGCELDTRATTGPIYWEGPVSVRGSVAGSGYGEFTGYAGSLAGRF